MSTTTLTLEQIMELDNVFTQEDFMNIALAQGYTEADALEYLASIPRDHSFEGNESQDAYEMTHNMTEEFVELHKQDTPYDDQTGEPIALEAIASDPCIECSCRFLCFKACGCKMLFELQPTCTHEYELITTGSAYFSNGDYVDTIKEHLICKHCGYENPQEVEALIVSDPIPF